MPYDVTVNQRTEISMGSCIIYLGWNPLINTTQDDITHYMIYINGTNIFNKTKSTDRPLMLSAFPVCTCAAHQISVSAVDRCGVESQKSPDIIPHQESVLPVNECGFVEDNLTQLITSDAGKIYHSLIQSTDPLCTFLPLLSIYLMQMQDHQYLLHMQ